MALGRTPGVPAGRVRIGDDFGDPLPDFADAPDG